METSQASGSWIPSKRRLSVSSETSDDGSEGGLLASANADGGSTNRRRSSTIPSNSLIKQDDQSVRARDKKKRRKKKRKVSVVNDGAGRPAVRSNSSEPGTSRRRLSSVGSNAAQLANPSTLHDSQPVAGPSKASPASTGAEAGASSLFVKEETAEFLETDLVKVDKGKGRAEREASIPNSSDSQPSASSQLLVHQTMLNNVLQSLTCRVCLYLLRRPFALAPCGHVACYDCLVSWFSSPAGQPNDPPIPVTRRKKTCPHCRAAVHERPVEVWALKESIASLTQSGLIDADLLPPPPADGENKDASPRKDDDWRDIFPDSREARLRETMGIRDNEDGGIYRCVDCNHEIEAGICSGCQRLYPDHAMWPGGIPDFGSDYDDEDDDDDFPPYHGFPIFGNLFQPLGFDIALGHSDEDDEHDDGDDDEDDEDEEYEGSFIDDEENLEVGSVMYDPPIPPARIRRRVPRAYLEPISLGSSGESEEEDDEVQEIPPPARSARASRSRARLAPVRIVVSDSEEENDEVVEVEGDDSEEHDEDDEESDEEDDSCVCL
ncbi:hypothetical protein K474DRAFT_1657831 [Panus rudis PR-1116 ss-1]|nr:hypothetical protein K474DRAFT_1657831 [Panus rudis PR-1116 ss-1]